MEIADLAPSPPPRTLSRRFPNRISLQRAPIGPNIVREIRESRECRIKRMQTMLRRLVWLRLKLGLAAIPLVFGLGLSMSWDNDNAVLRQKAMEVTAGLDRDSARIIAINDWVYYNQGSGKNKGYFLIPALGPTPLQVLASGGDCADKSRLVAAMLDEINIKAGLMMISTCLGCEWIHTLVEAQYERGRMVVDPIWHVHYPAGNGKYLGVQELSGTDLGRRRIVELQQIRGADDKITRMPLTEATFDYAAAINWKKSELIRTVKEVLQYLGYEPESIFRPRFLEDPKLTLIAFSDVFGILVFFAIMPWARLFVRRASLKISDPGWECRTGSASGS